VIGVGSPALRAVRVVVGWSAVVATACGAGDGGPDVSPRPDARPDDAGPCDVTYGEPTLGLARIADGLDRPVHLTSPPDDPRLFVLELARGVVRIIEDGVVRDRPFLRVDGDIASGFEQGILSLAFHPRYADNGRLFVSWARDGDDALVVEEWQVDPGDPGRADPSTRRVLLEVAHTVNFHYGAHLAFGADGMLHVSVGDGGPHFDPEGHGQSVASLRGKLLRIDVDRRDGARGYGVPDDNPFVGVPGARGEIWAMGLRNPWRFSIDPASQHIYIGDVGFDTTEEIDVIPAGDGGLNFGWAVLEGATECIDPADCDTTGLEPPTHAYTHASGCAVIAGPVYRGCAMPGHHGKFFYGDFCQGWVRSLIYSAGEVGFVTAHPGLQVNNLSAFGVDALGEVYLLDFDLGTVDQVVPVR
jgi:glucose/arabinose dehydrogenase